uniref:Uncharacterized protein n=1 Tax=viral metagenome TaxID=1070528 RepID=A0A6M3LTF0_9ZZZZ
MSRLMDFSRVPEYDEPPEDDELTRIIIDVGIIEDKLYTFAPGGKITVNQSTTNAPITINLTGLEKYPHIIPTIQIREVNLNKRMLSVLG